MTKTSGQIGIAAAILLVGSMASAQLSAPSYVNSSSGNETVTGACHYARRSSVANNGAPSGTSFSSRYIATTTADNDAALGGCAAKTETLATNYTVNFTATAPAGAPYKLTITTRRKGDMNMRDDGSQNAAAADITAASCSLSNATTFSGTCSLVDPGGISGGGNNSLAFDQPASLIACATGTGAPLAHALNFSWTQSGTSPATGLLFSSNADEGAVRLGDDVGLGSEIASDYPGSPARVQTDDGHFVTVAFESTCGNGIVDGNECVAEQCDEGVNNGTAGSCCNADCTLKSAGTECRDENGDCDVAEECDGVSGACPADAFLPAATLCRAATSAEVCDVDDFCDGLGPNCADNVEPPTTVCRAASPGAVCDITEFCDGTNKLCPTDTVEPPTTVCRAAASVGEECDIDEFCDGSGYFCPPDAVEPSSTVCRGAAGVCDVAETCDGSNKACPGDAVESSSTVCRAASAGQECDAVETCDGVGVDCPADGVELAGTTCRNAAGVCDLAETCDGVGSDCPADGPKSTALCRPAAGVCDVAESCDGVNDDCPSDVLVPDTTPCDDSNFCNGVQVCTAGVCGGGSSPCMVGESCDEGADICYLGCPPSPTACLAAGKSKVLIKNNTSDNTKDKLIFKWLKGPATVLADFADPTASADYFLCFYDDSGLLQSAEVPASASKWAPISTKGYKYKDTAGAEDGITKIIVKSGAAGKSKAIVKGKGVDLPDFDSDLPVGMADLPMIVQLRNNSNGKCFEGVFASPKKDLATQFNAKTP